VKRVLAVLLFLCTAAAAHADGGRLQMRQAAGPFVISLFTQPESLGLGQADLTAMIEEQGSGKVLLDSDVVITLTPEDEQGKPIVVHLSHAHASNRLLQDAVVQLPRAGRWRTAIQVNDSGRSASVTTDLTVGDYSARRGTVWVFALFPVFAIALFAWVQIGKRSARGRDAFSPV
jgi:hypothetical protein